MEVFSQAMELQVGSKNDLPIQLSWNKRYTLGQGKGSTLGYKEHSWCVLSVP